jgi:hypothetical protein
VTDIARLSGKNAATATGTVTFTVYGDASCTTVVASAGKVTVGSGKAVSAAKTLPKPGAYYWQASYSGDSKNLPSETECGSEIEEVLAGPQPTTLSTELEGEGRKGARIAVKEGAGVADTATVAGSASASASGSVAYDIYTDSACTHLLESAGTKSVAAGKAPSSDSKALTAGTYYWQASYSGDATDDPSTSACGSEVLEVKAELLPPPTRTAEVKNPTPTPVMPVPKCTEAKGKAAFGARATLAALRETVSTRRAAKQRLSVTWGNGRKRFTLTKLERASCRVGPRASVFVGVGRGRFDGRSGYEASFAITIARGGNATLTLRIRNGRTHALVKRFPGEELKHSTEAIF